MIVRFPDWPARLEKYLFASLKANFKYGSFDCALFAANCIEAMTGVDLAASLRGKYDSRTAAKRAIEARVGRGSVALIAEALAAQHEMPEIKPVYAGRGDMVLLKRSHDYSLGIVALTGTEIMIALGQGWGRVPVGEAVRAWRV